jgi:hypothetical protein
MRAPTPGWAMRPEARVWTSPGDPAVTRHNRYHSVMVRSCKWCAHHGTAVIVHPLSGRPA